MSTRAVMGFVIGFEVLIGSLGAQTPAPAANAHHLSLYANLAASGGGVRSHGNVKLDPGGKPLGGNWVSAEEQHLSSKREAEDSIGLQVEVRNLARTPDTAKLEWLFYGRKIQGGEPYIFDSGAQDVTVPPVASSNVELQSKPLAIKVEKKLYITDGVDNAGNSIAPQGSVKRTGDKVVGWVVRICDGNTVLGIRASSATYETIGRTAVLPTPPPTKKKK